MLVMAVCAAAAAQSEQARTPVSNSTPMAGSTSSTGSSRESTLPLLLLVRKAAVLCRLPRLGLTTQVGILLLSPSNETWNSPNSAVPRPLVKPQSANISSWSPSWFCQNRHSSVRPTIGTFRTSPFFGFPFRQLWWWYWGFCSSPLKLRC